MNDNFKTLLTFVLGAAAGSAVTWYFLNKKHEQEMQELNDSWEEWIDSPEEETYEEEYQDELRESIEAEDAQWDRVAKAAEHINEEKPSIQEYAVSRGYEIEEGDDAMDEPVVITPEEFSELDYEGYSTETLTLYADGVLTDFLDDIIENVDDLVGEESLNHFGEYEEDTVFVRNDHLMTGYEIQRDNRTYAEVVGK